MRKKFIIYTTSGRKIEYRGYEDMTDDDFLELYKDDSDIKKIVRQYYPLKYNKKETIFTNFRKCKVKEDCTFTFYRVRFGLDKGEEFNFIIKNKYEITVISKDPTRFAMDIENYTFKEYFEIISWE